ncbi:MAG: hypothetical protein SVY41_03275 [Candidatus Nanohaloarchaea archaeon]|nr:hypothetical protein [Candidatus Nanohaloarchaea archaeon]
MGGDRVPLEPDEDDDEPVTMSAEELRAGIDRNYMDSDDESPERQRQRRSRPQQRQSGEEDNSGGRQREAVEEKAVQRMVEKLREKGKSDQFIQEHMDEIREKVRRELSR